MYWTEQEVDGNYAVVRAGMDGSIRSIMRSTNSKHLPSISTMWLFHTYWVDSSAKHIEHAYTLNSTGHPRAFFKSLMYPDLIPQHITIHKMQLYWVGASTNSSSTAILHANIRNHILDPLSNVSSPEYYIAGNLTGITGLSKFELTTRHQKNPCAKADPCAGICLLGLFGSKCKCPVGFHAPDWSLNRTSCAGSTLGTLSTAFKLASFAGNVFWYGLNSSVFIFPCRT